MAHGLDDEMHRLMFGPSRPHITPELLIKRLREESLDAMNISTRFEPSEEAGKQFLGIALLLDLSADQIELLLARVTELEAQVAKPKVPTIIMCTCGWKGQQRELRANRHVTCRLDCPSCGAEFVELPKDMPL